MTALSAYCVRGQSIEQSRHGPSLAQLVEDADFRQAQSFMVRLWLVRVRMPAERTAGDVSWDSWRK